MVSGCGTGGEAVSLLIAIGAIGGVLLTIDDVVVVDDVVGIAVVIVRRLMVL